MRTKHNGNLSERSQPHLSCISSSVGPLSEFDLNYLLQPPLSWPCFPAGHPFDAGRQTCSCPAPSWGCRCPNAGRQPYACPSLAPCWRRQSPQGDFICRPSDAAAAAVKGSSGTLNVYAREFTPGAAVIQNGAVAAAGGQNGAAADVMWSDVGITDETDSSQDWNQWGYSDQVKGPCSA